MSNEITLVQTRNGDLVDPNTSKMEQLETKLDEVETNLIDLADESARAVSALTDLAIASQNPEYFEALAKLIAATAKTNKDAGSVIVAKKNLYKDISNLNKPITDESPDKPSVTNNNLIMTSTELLEQILKNNGTDK